MQKPFLAALVRVATSWIIGPICPWFAGCTIVQDEKVAAAISNPKLEGDQRVALMLDICGEHLDARGSEPGPLLVRNGRLSVLPEIAHALRRA